MVKEKASVNLSTKKLVILMSLLSSPSESSKLRFASKIKNHIVMYITTNIMNECNYIISK